MFTAMQGLRTDFESDAFDNNIVRLEILPESQTVICTSFNSKNEQTAQSFTPMGRCANA